MSPLFINMLLWFHCRPEPWKEPSPAALDVIKHMLHARLIVAGETNTQYDYRLSERGDALVKMLCATPFPINRWLDPRFAEHPTE